MTDETSESERDWDAMADRLGRRAVADGAPTRWFEELWSAASRDEVDLPWNRTDPSPPVADYVAAHPPTPGARAVVVGAGLGADAEFVARHGYRTTAFDIAPSAVTAVRDRYPDSEVDYRVADLLHLPVDLTGAFDLVVEVFTVQALDPAVRTKAQAGIRRLLAPGGRAIVVQMVRPDDRPPEQGPPWLLDREEMEAFGEGDVGVASLDVHRRDGAMSLWVAELERA